MNDVFSIIVLLYNNHEYLDECLESIMIQNYPHIEIIVVDDGSESFDRDGIVVFLESKKRANIVNYIVYQNETNIGTVKSANGAIKKATGAYIKLLAADDALYDEHSLANAAEALKKSQSGVMTGDVMRCDKELKPISKYRNSLPEALNRLEPLDVFRRLCTDSTERVRFVLASYNAGMGHIMDAIALAKKHGHNPQLWYDNVETAALMKSNPQFYNDPVCRYGYFRARETVAYVKKVENAYYNYRRSTRRT